MRSPGRSQRSPSSAVDEGELGGVRDDPFRAWAKELGLEASWKSGIARYREHLPDGTALALVKGLNQSAHRGSWVSMVTGFDFSELDLRSALDFAIGNEEDAQVRYQEFAARVSDPAAAKFFRFMVEAECSHRRQLEARRDVLFRHCSPRFDTSVASDEWLPDPEEINSALSVREAMEVALRAEIRSCEFYAAACGQVKDAGVRASFEALKEEEEEHEAEMRKILDRLPPAPCVQT